MNLTASYVYVCVCVCVRARARRLVITSQNCNDETCRLGCKFEREAFRATKDSENWKKFCAVVAHLTSSTY
jgi:hypothetical protein